LRLLNCDRPVFNPGKYKPRLLLYAIHRFEENKRLALEERQRLFKRYNIQPLKKIGFRLSIFVFFSLFSS